MIYFIKRISKKNSLQVMQTNNQNGHLTVVYISCRKSLLSSLEQKYKDVMNVELCLSDVALLLIVFGLV